MAIQAQRNRARLHVLRDNVHRAKRDVKRKLPGAAERLKAHQAVRLAFAEPTRAAIESELESEFEDRRAAAERALTHRNSGAEQA